MSFVEKQTETFAYVKNLKSEFFPVSMRVESGEVISKVLSVMPVVKIEQVLVNNKNAQIEGKLCAKVIIQTAESGFKCVFGVTNFKTMVLDDLITSNSEMFALAKVCGVSGLTAGSQSISFNVNVCVLPKLLIKSNVDYLASVKVAESKTTEVKFSSVVASSSQEFNLETELEQPSNVSEILCVDSNIQLSKVEAGVDVVRLSGEVITNLIYLDNDEPAKLKNQFFTQNFSHELLASNLTPQDVVNLNVSVCNTEMQLDGELNSSKGTVILNHTIKANILVEQEKTVNLVVDAFCPRYNLNLLCDTQHFCSTQNSFSSFEKIDGSVLLGEDSARIDRVLCVSGQNIVVESTEVENENVVIVGKMVCNVVFTLDDENCSVNSILTSIPFSLKLPKKNEDELCGIDIVVREVDARQKRAKEIDVVAEVGISVKSRAYQEISYLSDLTLGSERTENFAPMSIYFVKNAPSLWELSKLLCVSGDVILEQNPNLVFPITDQVPVLIYRKRAVS